MSEQLPDDILVELIASFERAIDEQRARVPPSLRPVVAKTFNTAEWIREGLAELRDRRAADLTDEAREALRWLRTMARTIQRDRVRAGSDVYPNPARALAVLDKLIGGAP